VGECRRKTRARDWLPLPDHSPAKRSGPRELGRGETSNPVLARCNHPGFGRQREERDAPYFTDRPGWDGYSALVVLAASVATETPVPEQLPENALGCDIVLRAQSVLTPRALRSITQAQLWLPGTFDFSFEFVDLCEQKVHISSVASLVCDLATLREAADLTPEQLGDCAREQPASGDSFQSLSLFGLAVFTNVAREALKYRLPVLLSF
jgi:hypothetical protein